MVDAEALAANLKVALREATERFRLLETPVAMRDITVNDIEFISFNAPSLAPTERTARAVYIIPDWNGILLLVDETKLAIPSSGRGLTYFSLQADGVVERLIAYLDGDINAAREELQPVHDGLRQLFR